MAVRIDTITLTADAAQSPTITGNVAGRFWEITHHGLDATTGAEVEPVYFRTDGTTAVKVADENRVVLSGERVRVPASHGTGANLSLISASGALVTIERL